MENQDSLFDLCKQVYEKTGWIDDDINYYARWQKIANLYAKVNRWGYDADSVRYRNSPTALQFKRENEVAPLYTSDHLLEKLPRFTIINGKQYYLKMRAYIDNYAFLYVNLNNEDDYIAAPRDNTPLKALLKLTLALSEAGEL